MVSRSNLINRLLLHDDLFSGYGHTHPVTLMGKTLCIVYAILGIPLALFVLGGIGEKLSALREKVNRLQLNPDSPSANK